MRKVNLEDNVYFFGAFPQGETTLQNGEQGFYWDEDNVPFLITSCPNCGHYMHSDVREIVKITQKRQKKNV